jgi:hypothetical protein
MAENLTNYRDSHEDVKVTGSVRRGNLDATFGNSIVSSGTAITGPFVRGRGGNVHKSSGRFIFGLAITQPTTFTGDASGHLVRGRAGINKSFASIGVVASDYSRPSGYTTFFRPSTCSIPMKPIARKSSGDSLPA